MCHLQSHRPSRLQNARPTLEPSVMFWCKHPHFLHMYVLYQKTRAAWAESFLCYDNPN